MCESRLFSVRLSSRPPQVLSGSVCIQAGVVKHNIVIFVFSQHAALVAGAWTEREKMFHGGSFLKLADDNMDIQNPEAQNRELSGF